MLGALILVLGHAAELAHIGEAVQNPCQLGMAADMALAIDEALFGVQAAGDVDGGQLHAAAAQVSGILPHGDGVHVHNAVDAVIVILQGGEILQRADVVAQRERTGGLDAGENNRLFLRLRGLNFGHGENLLLITAQARGRLPPCSSIKKTQPIRPLGTDDCGATPLARKRATLTLSRERPSRDTGPCRSPAPSGPHGRAACRRACTLPGSLWAALRVASPLIGLGYYSTLRTP